MEVDYDKIRKAYKECGEIFYEFVKTGIEHGVVNERLKAKILEELEYIAERLLPALSVGVNTDWSFELERKGPVAIYEIVRKDTEHIEESLMDYVYSLLFGSPYSRECEIEEPAVRDMCERLAELIERLEVSYYTEVYESKEDMMRDVEVLSHYIREGTKLLEGCLKRKLKEVLL